MALSFYLWNRTAASNASADPSVNWAEGMAPSAVNDSARAMMASTAAYRDDVSGAIVTGGASTAFTVTSYQIFDTLAHLDGKMIAFTPNATSTNAVGVDVTLNVDGLGAKPIRMQPNVALPGGTLILGTPYVAIYNNSDGVFYLHNTINPYVIPISAGFDYWGPTTPNSSFAFPLGQAISRTTYASLFSGNPWSIGTTYGTGDGSTTFNLPDKTGRVSAMKEAAATRLTSTYFGGNSTVLGATGGGEYSTLVTNNLPAYTPSGTYSGSITSGSAAGTGQIQVATSPSAGVIQFLTKLNGGTADGWSLVVTGNYSGSIVGTPQGGNSAPVRTVMNTIICNYIMRII